jgi:P pilus assembly chaperone PapD
VRFRISTFLASIGFLFFVNPVFAGMSLSQAIIHFEEGGERSRDIEVFNQGEETLYIRVIPSIIHHPGTEQEKREIYRNPREAGLLVSPQRLVIAPGGRKRIRFVRLDKPLSQKTDSDQIAHAKKAPAIQVQDRVFRVLVKPEVGEVKSSETAVKIVVAYEVLVLLQPSKATVDLKANLVGKSLHITNHGNTNVLLLEGHQCPKEQSLQDEVNQCVKLGGKRIYAGNQWQVEVPYLTPVTYQISKGLENSIKTFKLVQ